MRAPVKLQWPLAVAANRVAAGIGATALFTAARIRSYRSRMMTVGAMVSTLSAGRLAVTVVRSRPRSAGRVSCRASQGERQPVDPKVAEQRAKQERAEQQKKRELARWLWKRAEPNAAEVARYLSEARAIDLDRIGGVPAALGHLPIYRRGDNRTEIS